MGTLELLAGGLASALTPANLLVCLAGCLLGTLVGVLPGIGPVTTMAILFPLTFSLDPTAALIMLTAIYYGSQYGGSTTSILLKIPGELGAIVTTLDGYQLARQGRAGVALGISAIGSFVGGLIGTLGLMLLAPTLALVAISFGPPEFFALVVFGLMMISYLGTGSVLKAFVMATFGIIVSTIGLDTLTNFNRFAFGTRILADGVGLVPIAIGMFGLGEVLANVADGPADGAARVRVGRVYPSLGELLACRWAIVRGTIVGFVLGILPGAGTVLTPFAAYALEKRLAKTPERFGRGALEGVAAPETANNAATSGVMVPLLALGVPPNLAMAMLLGAFVVHGIQPGPYFLTQHAPLFWTLIASMLIGNVVLLLLNLPLIRIWVKTLEIPPSVLLPVIVVLCFIGVYGESHNVGELVIMLVFGVLGFALGELRYPTAPFLLALVLGPLLETNLRQSLLVAYGSPLIFVQHPISAVLLAAVAGIVLWAAFGAGRRALRVARAASPSP